MSRAIHINAPQDHVIATCAKRDIGISTIEVLQSGGTRVVMNDVDDVAVLAKAYGSKVIAGAVKRMPTRLNRL